MTRKHSYEYVFEYFQKEGYDLLDDKYEESHNNLSIVDSDGYRYHISFNCFDSAKKYSKFDYKPEKFSKRNKYTFENIKLWVANNNCTFDLCGGEYLDNRQDILVFRCHKCKESWNTSFDDIYCKKCACPYCAGKRISETNNLLYEFPDIAREWDYERNILLPQQCMKGSSKKAHWICKHGHRWESVISNRTSLGEGCPICEESHGEKRIREFLENMKIGFDPQKTFDDCRGANSKKLSFDFCVYDSCGDVFCLIEFQGQQHFMPVEYFGGNDAYLKRQMYDIYKKYYCHKKNYRLLRIDYYDFDKINQILERDLFLLLEGR